jgi:hypothetical protein
MIKIIGNKPNFLPVKKAIVTIACFMYIFHLSLTGIQIRIGFAPKIRIRTEIQSWPRICVETNADPQHW